MSKSKKETSSLENLPSGVGLNENGELVQKIVIEAENQVKEVSVSDRIKNHKQKTSDLKLRVENQR